MFRRIFNCIFPYSTEAITDDDEPAEDTFNRSGQQPIRSGEAISALAGSSQSAVPVATHAARFEPPATQIMASTATPVIIIQQPIIQNIEPASVPRPPSKPPRTSSVNPAMPAEDTANRISKATTQPMTAPTVTSAKGSKQTTTQPTTAPAVTSVINNNQTILQSDLPLQLSFSEMFPPLVSPANTQRPVVSVTRSVNRIIDQSAFSYQAVAAAASFERELARPNVVAVKCKATTKAHIIREPYPPVDSAGEWVLRAQFRGEKSFGYYVCDSCEKSWISAHSFKKYKQGCQGCETYSYPYFMWHNYTKAVKSRDSTERDVPHDRARCEACLAGKCTS